MVKKILSIGYNFPGNVVKTQTFRSRESLLDGDIILFMPTLSDYSFDYGTYFGKPVTEQNESKKLIDDINLWGRELREAFNNGKTLFIFLSKLEEAYFYNGRNGVGGPEIHLCNNYAFVPGNVGKVISSPGSEIKVSKELGILTSYWNRFGKDSFYEVYLENSDLEPILTTKIGNKIVGSILRGEKGTIIFLPPIKTPKTFIRRANGKEYWTLEAKKFGKDLSHILLQIDKALHDRGNLTPPPKWVFDKKFELLNECKIKSEIEQVSTEISLLEKRKKSLEDTLQEEGLLLSLLFETGKPLEKSIIKALKILGFKAEGYQDSESEFDAIFSSKEGSFLGEAEGKDNTQISIGKLDQLRRNISEYSEKEGTESYAKGVLFGNAYRLTEIEKRDEFFTKKCVTSAKRDKIALVKTPDLFFAARYLQENNDQLYAEHCRKTILETEGNIVVFPKLN